MHLSYAEADILATAKGVAGVSIDFIKFENISQKSIHAASPSIPLVTMSNQALYFNTTFQKLHPNFKTVAIFYYNNQLLLSFYQDYIEENSIRLSRPGEAYSCAFMKQAQILEDRSPLLNLADFNYKYVVDLKPNCYQIVIDLQNPYTKRKRELYWHG